MLIVLLGYVCLKFVFKDVNKWSYIANCFESKDIDIIRKIREKSFRLPHIIVLLQIIIPIVSVGALFIALGFRNSADLKFFMILMANLILIGEISYLFSKSYFRQVLKFTYINELDIGKTRIGLQLKIFIQIIPLFLFSIMLIIFLGRACITKEKGDLLFKSYQRELKTAFNKHNYIDDKDQIKQNLDLITLENKKDITFYIDPTGNYKTSDNSRLSKFFLKYTHELAFNYNGHTYDYYGSDSQGSVIKVQSYNGDWIVGIKYIVSPNNSVFFIIGFIFLSLVAIFVIFYFGKTITDDISLIASGLKEIAEGEEVDLIKKIPVTSSDEIGDLVIAFNKVQEREKKHVQNIKDQQKVIVAQEKLASLGQMISGITHNLKTPITSLSVAVDSLKDLVTEYQKSINDIRVTVEDHQEIAVEMNSWLIEMKPYCEYMVDVLTTIKGQIIRGTPSLMNGFTLKELIKRIEIITHYELTKSDCVINFNIRSNSNLTIPGEISDLVQVLENIVSNSIQAYLGRGGEIEFVVVEKGEFLEFQIKDTGVGIPEKVQSKLFKEIITTKGKKGTGLGLYISLAIVKGKFNGDIYYDSIEGKGSSFYITIPVVRLS